MARPGTTEHRRGRSGKAWRARCAEVYETESHCAYCGEWVDQSLPPTDAMGRTVDHLQEMWLGGFGLPPRDQTKLMHRRCNTRKSNAARLAARGVGVLVKVDLGRV